MISKTYIYSRGDELILTRIINSKKIEVVFSVDIKCINIIAYLNMIDDKFKLFQRRELI